MNSLTPSQLRRIKKIIDEYTEVLVEVLVGTGKVPTRLSSKFSVPKEVRDLIAASYKYGKLNIKLGKPLVASTRQIDSTLKDLALSPSQRKSVEFSHEKARLAIDSLNAKIASGVITHILQDQFNLYETIREVIPDAVKDNTPRYKVIQQLREASKDWERDWHRVAHTEMWDAKLQGEANAIIDGESPFSKLGGDTMVYKRPAHNACNKCKQLYLEPDGVTPKLFKLSELQANGNNYGKKQSNWKPTVGILHPNCMCVLNVMPTLYTFDATGQPVLKK